MYGILAATVLVFYALASFCRQVKSECVRDIEGREAGKKVTGNGGAEAKCLLSARTCQNIKALSKVQSSPTVGMWFR